MAILKQTQNCFSPINLLYSFKKGLSTILLNFEKKASGSETVSIVVSSVKISYSNCQKTKLNPYCHLQSGDNLLT